MLTPKHRRRTALTVTLTACALAAAGSLTVPAQASPPVEAPSPAATATSPASTGAASSVPDMSTPHKVSYDAHSLTIDGKPLYIWSGEFHYWRLPSPDAWRDILQKMKAGGYNATSIYFDWGFHSAKPGSYDFTGLRDVDRLLDMAEEAGIYVIARPGPYINAETDGGGFPGYLTTQKGKARTTAPDYLKSVDEWLSKIDPIIARHQLSEGKGPVIAYQVENEYYKDTADGHAYIRHLVDQARDHGITVPLTGNHNGTFAKELDIDGSDSYPQGFNCSSPDRWNKLPDWSRAKAPDEPLFLAEFQGGAFDPWGGPGYGKCRQLTNGEFEKAAYENNIASGATLQNFYMAYGGTSWGWLPAPKNVYTSYDYGASISEDRQLTEKYLVNKRLGYFVQSVAPLTRTGPHTAAAPDNTAVSRRDRRNPDTGTTFTVVRHKDVNDKSRDTTHLALGSYPTVPQKSGTALTIDARDTKTLVADYAMDHQRLRYSTSEIMTHGTFGDRDVALFYGRHGQDGESVLHYDTRPDVKVLSGSVAHHWDPGKGDLRLNYRHDGLAHVLVTPAHGTPLLLLLADDATADTYWRLDTPDGPVLATGPELLRTADYDNGVLRLTGDTDKAARLRVLTGTRATSVTWNGERAPGALDTTGAALAGPKSVTLPKLGDWRFQQESPEARPDFDDAAWRAADGPSLAADHYGFHTGSVWYRGHFTATGQETSVRLNVSPGKAGSYLVWLGGRFLGSSRAGEHTFTIPSGVLKPGKDNVLAVLTANMAHNVDWSADDSHKEPRGLLGATLTGSERRIGWRLQGALGGEDLADPVRGPLNTGGLYGERHGMHLPGYPSDGWQKTTLPHGDDTPGVSWYRTTVDLDLPSGQDVPLGLRIDDDGKRHYRALLYVNGWMAGLYINDLGPQKSFPVPPGMLRTKGGNTIAIAVINEDGRGGGLGSVSLESYGNHTTPLRYGDLASPSYAQVPHRDAQASADVRVTAPDTIARGATGTVTATFTPRRSAARNATLALGLPPGWKADPAEPRELGTVPAGRTVKRSWTVTASSGAGSPWTAAFSATAHYTSDGRPATASAPATVLSPPPPPNAGTQDVSSLEFDAENGWGPVERNTSNGEEEARDGKPITIAGTRYDTGLGVHANSAVTLYLGGSCTRLTGVAGIDDETGDDGSAVFSVLADGKPLRTTDVITGRGTGVPLDTDITGARVLELRVTDGGDGNSHDHADWARARLTCG
ncbi:beta-galactosidase [Streptomyces sp. HD1123-B1]|uniref:beta-galactosidase n=1 Tax=Streptomyces huangiella TaxID=3228804 RepID=UPI003D7CC3AC